MPSTALLTWQNDRTLRLVAMDAHCAAAAALAPANVLLAEESLLSHVMLLSGHFQGFCRDLYSECVQVFAANVAAGHRPTVQAQFAAEMKINTSNPTQSTITNDFERFAFTLDFDIDPANALRLTHLGQLNKWRNHAAHQKVGSPAGVPPLNLAVVQGWRVSCNGLATWLDGIMHAELQRILVVVPW